MKKNSNSWNGIALISAAALTLFALPVTGFSAQPETPRVIYPQTSKAETGMTYDEWSVLWWQYALAQPVSGNPILGAECGVGQTDSSPVFFLAGSNNSEPVVRYCTVPEGKKLFFPLVNGFDVHTAGDGLDTPAQLWKDFYSSYKLATPNGPLEATGLYVRINNVDVEKIGAGWKWPYACGGQDKPGGKTCASTPGFIFPAHNILGLVPGVYASAVVEGYYLMLDALPAGSHTIEFGGSAVFKGESFQQNITYNIFVKPNAPAVQPPKAKSLRIPS